jgi:hypothetical protein
MIVLAQPGRVALRILPGPASGDRVVSRSGWATIVFINLPG